MKTKFIHVGKRTLSVVLSIMMIVSMMIVGMVTVNAAIQKWTIASWSINGNWDKGNANTTINGAIGSFTVKTSELAHGAGPSGTIYFKVFASEDGGSNWIANSSSPTSVSENTSYQLTWDSEQQLTFNFTKSYVTFDLSTNGTNNYLKVTQSDTEPSSGEDAYDTHIYALSKQSSNMKLHVWNEGSSGLSNGGSNSMTLVAKYNDGLTDYYLWKIGYNMQSSCPNFIIYCNSGNLTDQTKLTGDVTNISATGDYFFDLHSTDLGIASKTDSDGSYKSLSVTGTLTTSSSIKAGDSVTLSNEGISVSGSVYGVIPSAYTTSYAIDSATVTSPWTATAGNHTITATVSGGTDSSSNVYESVTSDSASFTVTSSITQLAKPSISVDSNTIAAADESYVTLTVGTSYDSAANVSYELYKDGATPAYATFSTSTYQITEAGTYQVKAISGNTSSYSNSELSDSVIVSKAAVTSTDYYIVGNFTTSSSSVTWNEGMVDNVKFTKTSDTLYKLETGKTLSAISGNFFAIKAGSGKTNYQLFGRDSDYLITNKNKITLTKVSKREDHCLKFDLASDSNTNPVTLCLDVTDPDAPVFYYEVVFDTEKYSVTMEQGISTPRTGKAMGSSYLDNVTNQTTVTKSIEDLAVTFKTQTTDVSADATTLGYTGKYMYQVYGYSINMTLNDGTTRVASVVNSLVDSNSAKPISALANGIYTCEYTFPSNISSATVTPIFSVSADYAKAKGISYTAVYLKMTPGSNLLGNATEPKYYTWRAKADSDKVNTPYLVGDKNLEREPEGVYGGQKMLYIGNDMYVAYVQSDLYGILFDNGTPQTFDFNEFIKLQKLGYNNITFEPKSSTQSVASTLHNSYNANGVMKYEDSAQPNVAITTDNVNNEFELDVDIEGYYIDVFGNKLIDTDGNAIKRSDFVATLDDTSVSGELSALLTKTGASTEIYGARYGSYDRPDSDYGMRYSVYNYYVSGGTTKKLISQQVSGYGTIEGAMSPKNSSKTNAAYQASLLNPDYLTYFDDSTGTTTEKYFETGYELIPETYKGVPYLVSYKTTSDNRTDGKWYYMNTTPQVTVNVKTSLLNIDGSLNMSSAGKIVENTTPGTATVNYKSFDTIDQGTSAVMRATPNEGFAFVGFYEENGDFISKYNPYGNKVFAVDTTVYAVFKEVADGTITITNNIYDSAKPNPTPGGGNGKVSVTLVITPWDHDDEQGNPVYGTPLSYTGETSVSATINDGDKFHIILTGERTGADNFLAFRMPDKDIDGNIYYVALDDAEFLNVTKDPNGKAKSAIYTTADMVWDWTEQLGTGGTSNTLQAKTFNYYTDFSKTDINATLEYRYKDRFGNWKTYIVKNVPMDVSQINEGNYVPDNILVLQYAPPIDEVFNSCSWKATDIDARNSYALLEADQTYKTFNTYVDRNADGINSPTELIVATFNESIQIEAPETKGSATFKYWKRYLLDSTGSKSGSGEIFSNMRSISIKVTFDSVFEPVYDAVSDTYFTNVQDAKYTREKSTDDKGVVHDYVYADFLLQFDTLEGNDTFKNIVAKNGNIKFGVILEMDYNYLYDGNTITTPKTDENLLKQTITQLNTDLAEGGHKSGWNATTDSGLAQYNYYYNLFDLTDKASNLSNFGRYDYFFKFDNSEANRARVYNVYSYIIYTDSDSNEQIVVSKPKTLSIYATGIKNDGETAQV